MQQEAKSCVTSRRARGWAPGSATSLKIVESNVLPGETALSADNLFSSEPHDELKFSFWTRSPLLRIRGARRSDQLQTGRRSVPRYFIFASVSRIRFSGSRDTSHCPTRSAGIARWSLEDDVPSPLRGSFCKSIAHLYPRCQGVYRGCV